MYIYVSLFYMSELCLKLLEYEIVVSEAASPACRGGDAASEAQRAAVPGPGSPEDMAAIQDETA